MPLLSIVSVISIIMACVCLILTFKNKLKFFAGAIASSGLVLLSVIVNIYRFNRLFNADLIADSINSQFEALSQLIAQIPAERLTKIFGGLSNQSPLEISQSTELVLAQIKEAYFLLFPSLLILNILAIVFSTYMIVKQLLGLFNKDVSMHPKFSQFFLKRSAAIMLAAVYTLSFFTSNAVVTAAFINISAILGGVCAICGLSLIDHRLRQNIKHAWLRLALYIAVFFITFAISGFIIITLVFIAFFDSFADYRRLQKKEVKEE